MRGNFTAAWEPVNDLRIGALDNACNIMCEGEAGHRERYGCTVIGFDLDDPEGCQSLLDIATREGATADGVLAQLVVRGLRRLHGLPEGDCPRCCGGMLTVNAEGTGCCSVCGAEVLAEDCRDIRRRWNIAGKVERERCQEGFEEWAEEKGLCLDMVFMSSDGVAENPYLDDATYTAYGIWLASWKKRNGSRGEERTHAGS